MSYSGSKGFTAMELMVTMTVSAVLLATAVPSFRNYSWNLKMRTAMDQLQSDMTLARGYAISHHAQTVVCPALDADSCSGESRWEPGWLVFVDLNGDRQKQPGEPVLKHSNAIENLNINSSRSRSYIRFLSNGTSPGSNISIQFCDQRGAEKSGIVLVSNTGRIRQQANTGKSTKICP